MQAHTDTSWGQTYTHVYVTHTCTHVQTHVHIYTEMHMKTHRVTQYNGHSDNSDNDIRTYYMVCMETQ